MAEESYWLSLFTPETWHEVGGVDHSVSGSRANRKALLTTIRSTIDPGAVGLGVIS